MDSNQSDREASRAKSDRTAEELGRRAARLLRRGKPQVEKALKDAGPQIEQAVNKARPQAEKAAKDAWRYAQDHEDEIKRAAVRGARMRVRGPFGFLIDAIQSGANAPKQDEAEEPRCASCGTAHAANARFCSACGASVQDGSS
jgi:hypothetical protein